MFLNINRLFILFLFVGCARPGMEPGLLAEEMRLAVLREDAQQVEKLLERGADYLGASGKGAFTPLHYTAMEDHIEIASLIIQKASEDGRLNAALEAEDAFGFTPLMWAAGEGRARVTDLLLRSGADPDRQAASGNTALHYAALSQRKAAGAAVKLLLAYEADTTKTNTLGMHAAAFARSRNRADMAALIEGNSP